MGILLVQNSPRDWPGRYPEEHKKIMASAAILDFQFFDFWAYCNLAVHVRLCVPNFIMIGITAKTLLAFLFSIWNALKVHKNWGFDVFWGENLNIYLFEPQKASPCAKTRVLTFYSPKSVHNCDLWRWARKKTDIKDFNVGGMLRKSGVGRFQWNLAVL